MEKMLSSVGSLLYGMRFTMLFFYVGLVGIIFGILGKFVVETFKLMHTLLFGELAKIDLIIKVLELVDMTMVAQLVWVVALAGVSLFVTTGHFDAKDMKKPDWLDHVNTYNLKLKLAFAIISISGVHALKTYLSGDLSLANIQVIAVVALIHFTFVLSAIGISFAERLTRDKPEARTCGGQQARGAALGLVGRFLAGDGRESSRPFPITPSGGVMAPSRHQAAW